MNDRITLDELYQIFPEGVPIVAMKILFPEKSEALTLSEMREILFALSAAPVRSGVDSAMMIHPQKG